MPACTRAHALFCLQPLAVTPHGPRSRIREGRRSAVKHFSSIQTARRGRSAALLRAETQMRRSAFAVCCVLFLVSMEASAQSGQRRSDPQLGTWKLQSNTTEDLASGQKTDLFGANPSGYISYGPDCRM